MKIGFNVKKIYKYIDDMLKTLDNTLKILFETVTTNTNNISSLDTRVTTLENSSSGSGSSEWVEITSSNGQEAEITQEFSEIRLLAKCANANYSVTYSYDSTIFHNKPGNAPTYMICGNPTENNYGCKFKYYVTGNGKKYVSLDNCYNGDGFGSGVFKVWIKPVQA